MNVSPFNEVVANAEKRMADGWTIYQQFNCAKCGTKQTMPDANKFYTRGRCEECGHETNIQADGCNFMAVSSGRRA
jgi:DNA-directed RNA polymerase subunit RPC12/RpoP